MSRNLFIKPDYLSLTAIPSYQKVHEHFDILILPGGAPGAKAFCDSLNVLVTIQNFRDQGMWVAAIYAGTTALIAAEKKFERRKKQVTSHPSVAEEIKQAGWEYSEERVVVDGKVVTSRG
jgi:protein DJ-1